MTMSTGRTARPDVDVEFARIVDELTRRGFLTGGLGAATLLGLAACGTDGPAAPQAAPRTVHTAQGDVAVPIHPSRVVTISAYAYKTMLDLNLTPIMGVAGAVKPGYQLPAYLDRMASVPSPFNADFDEDLEAVAKAAPDLIIGSANDKALSQLQKIAPTVTQDAGTQSWQEMADQTADAVNRTANLDPIRTAYDKRVADVGKRYQAQLQGKRWYVLAPGNADDWSLWLPDVAAGLILTSLGARFGDLAAGKTGHYKSYSRELIGDLSDGDVLLVDDSGPDPSSDAASMFANRAWQALPAARSGHVHRSYLLSVSSYGEANGLLDQIETICQDLQKEAP